MGLWEGDCTTSPEERGENSEWDRDSTIHPSLRVKERHTPNQCKGATRYPDNYTSTPLAYRRSNQRYD